MADSRRVGIHGTVDPSAYQHEVLEAVAQRWYDLLEERRYASDDHGRVLVGFQLRHNGTITAVHIIENTTGADLPGYVAIKAIQDPAPFRPMPVSASNGLHKAYEDICLIFEY